MDGQSEARSGWHVTLLSTTKVGHGSDRAHADQIHGLVVPGCRCGRKGLRLALPAASRGREARPPRVAGKRGRLA